MIASSVIRVGDHVYWRDPDDDICSGWGSVVSLTSEEWDSETIATIKKTMGAKSNVHSMNCTGRNRTNKGTKKMIENKNKEYWTATEVRYENGEIVWFGNLRGQLFETREAAWGACLDAYENMRHLHSSDIGFGMSTDPDLKRIDIWIDRDKSWVWEVQAVCVGGYADGNEYKRL